jgi:DNA repair protein RadA/Sms
LEHVVDTVLSFEGDRSHSYRILRAVKNRFGSASEIGVFEMGDVGLVEVANPSELFLSERPQEAAGSVVTALMEGSRPLEKKLGLTLVDQDIFLNVVGGIRAMEPAADLAIAAAVLSSFMDRPVPTQTVVMGEVGLAGEVRRISRAAARMNEAVRLGFRQVLAPRSNLDPSASIAGAEIVGVGSIGELASLLFTW